jgi:hypothetical protein
VSLVLRILFFTYLVSTFCEHSQAQTITISAAGYGSGTTSFNYYPSTQTFNFSGSFFGYSGYGSSSYSINSANSITIAGFYLYTYETLTVPAFSMARSGSSYNGSFYSSLLGTTVYVSVTDPYDSDSDGIPDLSDNVYNSPPVPPPQLSKPLSANLGQFFTYSPLFENSPTSYSATDLPPGISVNSGSGMISGRPTSSGYYRGTFTAYNSAGSASLDIPITIPSTLQSIPFSDNFSSAVSNRYMPAIFSPLASMSASNGMLRYTCSSSGAQSAYGAWLLNLPLPLSSSWEVTADVTMPSGWSPPFAYTGVGLRIEPYLFNDLFENNIFDGALGENCITLELNRSNQEPYANNVNLWLPTAEVEFLPTTSTSVTLRFVYDSTQKTVSAWYRTSSTTAWILVGSPKNFNPSSTGSWAESWGLTSSSSLQLTLFADTTSENGTSGKVITLDNLSITAFTPPTITSPLTSSGAVAGSFSYQTTATGNPTTYNLSGTLPTGLTFNSSTGRITGIPTQSGVFTVSLSATSGSYTGPSVSLRITIPTLVGLFPSGGGATANGNEWSSDYTAAKAFDGNNSTAWHSKASTTFPHILAYDCGSARSVSVISLNQGWQPANSVQVLGSNDNANWTNLGTFSTSAGLNTLSLSSAQSFRYWAIRAITGKNNGLWCVSEIRLGGYFFSSSPGATANGNEWSSDYTAAKAFDGNNSTAWHSKASSTYPHVLAYDCGSARSVSVISLNQGWQPANSVQVLGSNDNANWTNLGTFSTSAGLNTLSLSSAQSFRYWAIRAITGKNNGLWCVSEIRL